MRNGNEANFGRIGRLPLSESGRCLLRNPHVCLSLSRSVRALEKTRAQLQSEAAEFRSRALEEQKKRENQDALVRRLQKRVLLLTKV